MEKRALGTTGPELSVLGLGCNNFGMKLDAGQTGEVVAAALDAGITHFDTAEMYGEGRSEEFLGAALGSRRDEVVIASKYLPRPQDEAYTPGALARRIREGVEGSLRRLGTDRIDVWYQHYPDAEAPDDELVTTLDELVRSGKVLHLATSNVDAGQIAGQAAAARERGLATFAGVQSEWNLLSRAVEADVVPAARAEGMGVVPYFPLASGLLTGKYAAGQPYPDGSRFAVIPYFAQVATEDNFAAVARLSELAAARGHDLVSLAFGWLLAQPDVTSVIAGASTPAQVAANAGALGWTLDADDLAAVEAALAG
ncbi:aldo/keto reductase [Pimelobacter simplex]|uniref:aldo/keto reductase n=1 Tax=Nocardioides simplex TaxID=2045 RepID=UPI00214F86C1|nr:aldo/keto reductase [Pimelobacter simplex]UUW91130.1 aldo/keto reductase [Pimelobacter simplex]UUW94958.1 aldo/keto reductase [Pimelobacter simplex]